MIQQMHRNATSQNYFDNFIAIFIINIFIVFYSALKYLSVCHHLTCIYTCIHLVKTNRHRSVTNSNKPMAMISILNLLFCPRL